MTSFASRYTVADSLRLRTRPFDYGLIGKGALAMRYGSRALDFIPTVGLAAALLLNPNISACGQEASVNHSDLNKVQQAWTKRSNEIYSVTFSTTIEKLVKGRGQQPLPQPGNPFDEVAPKDDRNLTLTGQYAYERGKFAISTVAAVIDHDDPERLRTQMRHLTFDGRQSLTLHQETIMPLGTIEVSDAADHRMYVDVDFLAVGLWLFPKKVVDHVGWQTDRMRVEKGIVKVKGLACKRLRIPRARGPWTSAIDVDPARAYVPVRWRMWYEGKLTSKLSIAYFDGETDGPLLQGWSWVSYKDGAVEDRRTGQVTELTVNSDVDDGRFTTKFPVGTHILKTSGGKQTYHIQQPGGLAPLEEKDFGSRTPPGEA